MAGFMTAVVISNILGGMQRESTSCFNYIRESWDAIDNIAAQNGGLHNLSTKFHMCRYGTNCYFFVC